MNFQLYINRHLVTISFLVLLLFFPNFLFSQSKDSLIIQSVSLNYVSPDELLNSLSLNKDESGSYYLPINKKSVNIRFSYSSNTVLLTGNTFEVLYVNNIINLLDLPPRQIIIEAKIVEIDNEKSSEIGFDWQGLFDRTDINGLKYSYSDRSNEQEVKQEGTTSKIKSKVDESRISGTIGPEFKLGEILKILQENGTGKIINMPHIVTTNNREGTIFDGKRINYVAKASSYANILETNEITAGLMLKVTPSLGKAGYLNLNVLAKFTFLEYPQRGTNYTVDTDMPIESGQTLKNNVIIKNEESLILGGFKKTEYITYEKKVPILGSILPFLFSQEVQVEATKDVLIILKPKIIDLEPQKLPENI